MILTMSAAIHIPVLLKEAVEALAVRPGARYIDCTLGGGGHALAILERGGRLLGIDADPEAVAVAQARLEGYGDFILVNDNFANLKAICTRHGFLPVQGILFDLGLSSLQLESGERGFSFQRDEPLDMRLSPSQETTAADIVNTYRETELAEVIRKYGEEPQSRRIARLIVRKRPIETTRELANAVELAIRGRRGRIHPATRTFQALRIAVNRELENLPQALAQSIHLLAPGGRLVVISYHSLDDRLVKYFLREQASEGRVILLNRRVITPSREEVISNPRSRSAKLRAVERISMAKEVTDD